MKGLCKKIAATALAFLTIVSVLITAVPPEGFDWAMEAEAATVESPTYSTPVQSAPELTSRLNTLISKHKGTYWTTDGNASNSSGSTSKYYYGIQCNGFAKYIFNELFCTGSIGAYDGNKYYFPDASGATLVEKVYDISADDVTTVKRILSKGNVGDFIQVRRRGKTYGHSMILSGLDENGIWIFDCNSDGKCGVKYYYQTWQTFASKNIGLSLYHSVNYPKGGSVTDNVHSSSSSTPTPTATFNFHGTWATDNRTVTGTEKVWWKQVNCGETSDCNVSVFVDSVYQGTIYPDSGGFYSYYLDTSKFSNGTHTITATLHNNSTGLELNTSKTFTSDNPYFKFWGWDEEKTTLTGSFDIWMRQIGYGTSSQCDVNVYVDGKALGTLYNDDGGYFKYSLDTTKYSNGEHVFSAILRNKSGATVAINKTFTVDNPYFKFWGWDEEKPTLTGKFDIWMRQKGYGTSSQCDVNVYVDGTALGTIYNDDGGYFKYPLDTTKFSNGEHVFSAIIRNTSGDSLTISKTVVIDNPYFKFWGWDDEKPTITGTFDVWMRQFNCGTRDQHDVNIYINGIHQQTLYCDEGGYFKYSMDTTTLVDGEHTFKAILRTKSGESYEISKQFISKNSINLPTLNNIKISCISSHGYLVTCQVSEGMDIVAVKFPTRPVEYSDDDIIWYEAEEVEGVWCAYISTEDFDNYYGKYCTKVKAYNSDGDSTDYNVFATVTEDKTINLGEMFFATIDLTNLSRNLVDVEDSASSTGYTAAFGYKNTITRRALWMFYLDENGYYQIINDDTGHLLSLSGTNRANSVICKPVSQSVSTSQEWIISNGYDGNYVLSPRCNPELALDLYVASTGTYRDAIIYPSYNGALQSFKITKRSHVSGIENSKTEATLIVDDTLNWNDCLHVTPDDVYIKTLRFVSEDESVATVSSDGTITAVGAGTTRILAYPTDGSVLEYIDENGVIHNETCIQVNVVNERVPITGVVLSSQSKTIAMGETASVFATVIPENTTDTYDIAWISSDESIVTVDNGVITATGIGNAAVTVSVGTFTYSCDVNVVQPITSLEILCNDVVVLDNLSSFGAPVAMYPLDTTDEITWSSSDESVAIVNEDGTVTAVGNGECTITASAGGISSDFSVEVPMVRTTSLTLFSEDTALCKGESIYVSKEVVPPISTDPVIWTSSDDLVATVVDGTVTAIGGGNCTITATSGDCSESFNLTVYVPVESVTLDTTAIEMKVGSSYTFTATVEPADTTDSIFWFVDEPEGSDPVAVIDENGKLTAKRAGVTTVIVAVGDYYEICEVTVTEVSYDVVPNVNGGASKLYEPWGLRYFAAFNGEDIDKIADRGIAILKDTYYTDGMTGEEFCTTENVHIYLESKGELGFEEASTNNPNGRYYATLTEGIYSYDISAYYYVVPFAVMENGQTVYGTIKKNSMEKILNTNLNLTSITAEEKAICTCILDLKESVAAHYAASGVPGASIDMEIPRGSSQTAAASTTTTTQSGITPNIVAGASRLIEPWGLRYFATYTDSDSIADRGVVILCEKYFDSFYKTAQDKMRLNANSYVFTENNGTLLYDEGSGRYYATVTEGISSKDIADVYYVVPYVVLDNGSYVYGTVKQNSMMKIMNTNLNIASVSETEKEVSRDIIALYEAVQAYYAA